MPPAPSATASPTGSFTPAAFDAANPAAPLPAWWVERKREGFETFARLPLPRRTDETWRFSTIGGIVLDGYSWPAPGAAPATTPLGAPALVFANNRFVAGAAPAGLAARGVAILPLSEALRTHGELLRTHFMRQPQRLGSEKFAALHCAFVADGAFIHVPRGVEVDEPIVVAHFASGPGTAVFPHTLVVADENSRVTVVDYFASSDESAHFACGANDLYAGHGARIDYVAAQNWSRDALSFQLNSTVVRRDARVQSLNVHLGGRQARHESLSQLQAPGAFSEMLALTVAGGAQEFDQRTLQVHQAPDTKSDLLYKNALRDTARTIFSGLIVVDPDAQRTDAYQSNRNLMLSEEAEANSLPGLEIQANDVRCTHGATTGRVDREQEYYLRSRGIPLERARDLIVFGFFEDVLNRLQNAELHARLGDLIRSRFGVKT